MIHKIWKKIRKKDSLGLKDFSYYFIVKFSSALCLIILITGGFCVYQNIFAPSKLPLYKLTNGTIEIEFQTMSHIASSRFYSDVISNIISAKNRGYVLYFEGVRTGTDENIDDFNAALGINFEPGLYENLSELYGITAQNNADFLGLVNNQDYNVDLSIDEIMEIYNKNTGGGKNTNQENPIYDVNKEVLDKLSTINKRELMVLRFINQAFLNFIMKNETFRNTIIEKVGNTDLFSVILDDRNKYIVEQVYERGEKKIFLMYGLMHFEGILKLLQEKDPLWQIIDNKDFQTIYSF